jgi:hypothetical protein
MSGRVVLAVLAICACDGGEIVSPVIRPPGATPPPTDSGPTATTPPTPADAAPSPIAPPRDASAPDVAVARDAPPHDAGAVSPASDAGETASACTSKTYWTRANRGSQEMRPGGTCLTCHRMMRGPSFAIAGTVFPSAHEPDDCNGASGADVVIVDARGTTVTLRTNAAGNFLSRDSIVPPYKASVRYQGRERLMVTAQMVGDCNSCHTEKGAMMAPGRIILP